MTLYRDKEGGVLSQAFSSKAGVMSFSNTPALVTPGTGTANAIPEDTERLREKVKSAEQKKNSHDLNVKGESDNAGIMGSNAANELSETRKSEEKKKKQTDDLFRWLRQQLFNTQLQQLDNIINKANEEIERINNLLQQMQDPIDFMRQNKKDLEAAINNLVLQNKIFAEENVHINKLHRQFLEDGSIERDENGFPKDEIQAKYLKMAIEDAKKKGIDIDPRNLSDGAIDKLITETSARLIEEKVKENKEQIEKLLVQLKENDQQLLAAEDIAKKLVEAKIELERLRDEAENLKKDMQLHPEKFTREQLEEQQQRIDDLNDKIDNFWKNEGRDGVLSKAREILNNLNRVDHALTERVSNDHKKTEINVEKEISKEEDEMSSYLSDTYNKAAKGDVSKVTKVAIENESTVKPVIPSM